MRYKAGDRVRVRKDLTVGNVYGGVLFDKKKCPWLGKIVEISEAYTGYYRARNCISFVWTDDMLKPITDLTTSEVVAFGQVMCDSAEWCSNNCPVMKIRSKYSHCSCEEVKLEHTDEYVEAVTKWVVGDAGKKKEIETERCTYAIIKDHDEHIVCEERIKNGDSSTDILKRYCKEHEGTYYAVREYRVVVKED